MYVDRAGMLLLRLTFNGNGGTLYAGWKGQGHD
jgi:hypothetical protein